MGSPGSRPLFAEKSVADLRREVFEEIHDRADRLDDSSPDHIPEEMFVVGILSKFEFSIPRLFFDRVFARRISRDGDQYKEIHIPMVGKPINLHLAPSQVDTSSRFQAEREFEIVDGDVCVYIALDGTDASLVEGLSALLLDEIEVDAGQVQTELEALFEDSIAEARESYLTQTSSNKSDK